MPKFLMRLSIVDRPGSDPTQKGRYLSKFDVDAQEGRGYIETTKDPKKAMKFDTEEEVFETWQKQSGTHPLRVDGQPNRPLTMYFMAPEDIE